MRFAPSSCLISQLRRAYRPLALLFASLLITAAIAIRYNPSSSLPRGYYVERPLPPLPPHLFRGAAVSLCLEGEASAFGRRRGYLEDAPFSLSCWFGGSAATKKLLGLPGDTVRVSRDGVFIRGRRVAPAPPLEDSKRRPLAPLFGTHVLGEDQYWVGTAYPLGYDSRFFGPVARRQIRRNAEPLWTWDPPAAS